MFKETFKDILTKLNEIAQAPITWDTFVNIQKIVADICNARNDGGLSYEEHSALCDIACFMQSEMRRELHKEYCWKDAW